MENALVAVVVVALVSVLFAWGQRPRSLVPGYRTHRRLRIGPPYRYGIAFLLGAIFAASVLEARIWRYCEEQAEEQYLAFEDAAREQALFVARAVRDSANRRHAAAEAASRASQAPICQQGPAAGADHTEGRPPDLDPSDDGKRWADEASAMPLRAPIEPSASVEAADGIRAPCGLREGSPEVAEGPK